MTTTTDITPSAREAATAALASLAGLPAERDLIDAATVAGFAATLAAAVEGDPSLEDATRVLVLAQIEALGATNGSTASRSTVTDAVLDIFSALR